MTLSMRQLDALTESEAADVFRACCGSSHWVDEMVARRPFNSLDDLLRTAGDVWSACTTDDCLEAFSHHPRIGEQRGATQSSRAAAWSSVEQASVQTAASTVQEQLADMNHRYEQRFGHIYIVCASGKSAEEMLSIAQSRLANDAETEIRIAAEEQRKITELRLRKLLLEET